MVKKKAQLERGACSFGVHARANDEVGEWSGGDGYERLEGGECNGYPNGHHVEMKAQAKGDGEVD
jgi:hypothetical protein